MFKYHIALITFIIEKQIAGVKWLVIHSLSLFDLTKVIDAYKESSGYY